MARLSDGTGLQSQAGVRQESGRSHRAAGEGAGGGGWAGGMRCPAEEPVPAPWRGCRARRCRGTRRARQASPGLTGAHLAMAQSHAVPAAGRAPRDATWGTAAPDPHPEPGGQVSGWLRGGPGDEQPWGYGGGREPVQVVRAAGAGATGQDRAQRRVQAPVFPPSCACLRGVWGSQGPRRDMAGASSPTSALPPPTHTLCRCFCSAPGRALGCVGRSPGTRGTVLAVGSSHGGGSAAVAGMGWGGCPAPGCTVPTTPD